MTTVINKIRHRESNMELLRIIAMMLVLGVHFCGAALSLPDHKGNPELLSEGDWWKLVVESITIIGVDLFVKELPKKIVKNYKNPFPPHRSKHF